VLAVGEANKGEKSLSSFEPGGPAKVENGSNIESLDPIECYCREIVDVIRT
jgi:hypothetical protein